MADRVVPRESGEFDHSRRSRGEREAQSLRCERTKQEKNSTLLRRGCVFLCFRIIELQPPATSFHEGNASHEMRKAVIIYHSVKFFLIVPDNRGEVESE